MSILGIILLVLFCIVALLLIFLVAVQGENSVGLGGIFGGGSDSAFGSNTSSVLTRATTILVVVFMVLSLVVAIANKSSDAELLAAFDDLGLDQVGHLDFSQSCLKYIHAIASHELRKLEGHAEGRLPRIKAAIMLLKQSPNCCQM